jgi:hemerythrin
MAKDLDVGVEVIDRQHAELLALIGALVQEARAPGPGARLAPAVEALLGKVRAHFATEGELMRRHGFDGLGVHENAHTAFLVTLESLHRSLESARTAPIGKKIEVLVGEWLELHIEGYDKVLGRFLREAGER